MEPGTPLPSTSATVPQSGLRSTPPGSALAPPDVLLPTYPSSTLNNYYTQPASFTRYRPNTPHTSAPASVNFVDPNILPPSASQSRVPTLRHTPSSSFHSAPRNLPDTIPLSPLIFQPPSPSNNIAQPRRHSIFSPRIII